MFLCFPFSDGYHRSGTNSACVPIEQCLSGNFTCPKHSTCQNKHGWYECKAKPGYECKYLNELSGSMIIQTLACFMYMFYFHIRNNCTNILLEVLIQWHLSNYIKDIGTVVAGAGAGIVYTSSPQFSTRIFSTKKYQLTNG